MTTITKPRTTAQFIVSEAAGERSRAEGTVDATGGALEPGTVLGKLTATGVLVRHAPGASDGSENAVGVLYAPIGAVSAQAAYIARDAEIRKSDLVYGDSASEAQITATDAALEALGLIVR